MGMPRVEMTAQEFRNLFDAVSNWGRWDDDGRRGALNYLTPVGIAAAARLVRSGVTITLSQPLRTEAGVDVPHPAEHHMTMLPDVDIGSGSVRFAKDYVGVMSLDDPEMGGTLEDARAAIAEMFAYADALAAERADGDGTDLLSVLLRAEVEGARLSAMDVDLFFMLLMNARGHLL